MTTLDVAIIGAGIGGLCLAQGLRRAGIAVQAYERTVERTDWLQGYRIHVNPNGSRALHECLSPPAWQSFLDTVSIDGGGFGFTTEHFEDLLRFRAEELNPVGAPTDRHYGVSRIGLREVLLSGLEEVVQLGREFTHYEIAATGRVTAHFSDGSAAGADVLIGADGANSRVRGQLLPQARRLDTGIIAVAGKHRLPAADLPRNLTQDVNLVVPRRRASFFTAAWSPDAGEVRAPAEPPPPFLLDRAGAYVLWGYTDHRNAFPPGTPENHSGAGLQRLVLDRTGEWAPELRTLITGSDPETVNAISIRSAAPVRPWETGPVTLLGDAIHNMTPMGGVGANTALRDAALLCQMLVDGADRPSGLLTALQNYEVQMLGYGFAAVRQSLRHAHQSVSTSSLSRGAFRAALRTTAAVPLLRRRMAAQLGR